MINVNFDMGFHSISKHCQHSNIKTETCSEIYPFIKVLKNNKMVLSNLTLTISLSKYIFTMASSKEL